MTLGRTISSRCTPKQLEQPFINQNLMKNLPRNVVLNIKTVSEILQNHYYQQKTFELKQDLHLIEEHVIHSST